MKKFEFDPEYVKQLGREVEDSILANVRTEKILAQLSVEERLAGLEPEQRLAGLDIEVIEAYLEKHKQSSASSSADKKSTTRNKDKAKKGSHH